MPLTMTPRVLLCFTLLLAALTLAMPSSARVMPDLYEVSEAVPSRGTTDRTVATSRGLERVFVRVTGDLEIASHPKLAPELEQARKYVQGYRYESDNNQLYLHLSFDPQAVNDLIHQLQLPLWPNNRPGTLVWMAVDTLQGGRDTLRQEDYPELFGLLDGLALERGLPLDFPVMDLNDQRNMPLGSLWAQDEGAAERAGVRYRPDATLMGRLLQTSGERWQANWLLIHGGRSYAFDATGSSLEEVALRGVNEAANQLAERYAVRSSDTNIASAVVVEISGIRSFAAYSQATSYLQGLAQVSSADVVAVDGDRLLLSLTSSSQLQTLRDVLALNRNLQLAGEDGMVDLTGYRAPLGSAQNPLRYSWH
ncbi:DUF2066 domain-containing protein [Microbulbifer bruguierae]|uniref:DUF2066 domain-containing protein n=1 Tax=Microbulbifer bruguierae TaxID=3029061 RepID=A0ABY8NFJ1_9GAMM|nr:DUF2066 domain-containing protein [Microbulbifer bruguierae]WGL17691.1 DUF2066 domain-containing protein [Microbulbifer bruguierae]